MRRAELRVFSLLMLAVMVTVGGLYWRSLAGQSLGGWGVLRGCVIIGGVMACGVLGFRAVRREWAGDQRRAIEEVARVDSIRERIEGLQAQLGQLEGQRETLEAQVHAAEAECRHMQTMIDGIADAVLVTNGADEVVLANPVAAALFRLDLAAAPRPRLAECVPAARLVHDIGEIRANSRGERRRTLAYAMEIGGARHTFGVTMTCVVDSGGGFSGVVTVLHDTTREREVEALKSEFVSHVSHELRTPLSSIKAYAELLVDGEVADDATRQEFYHIIHAEADRLSRLIDNILNISRIESGKTRINRKPVDLAAVAKRVLEVAMPAAREKHIALQDFISPVRGRLYGDGDMIYQAVLNLVSNAIKYTPENGVVKVAVQMDEVEKQVRVLVIDSGVGIPPEAMKFLFEKFYRVEQHKSMAKGSGLGLNLTRQIIETVHHGKMVVESRPGAGSTFGFTLPVIRAEAQVFSQP